MKRALFVLFIVLLVFSGCGGAKSKSIPVVGEWEAFNDANDGGNSVIEMEVTEKDGMPAYRFTGVVNDEAAGGWIYGFTGWQVTPDEATLEALKTAKGISFKVVGKDKLAYSVKYRVSDVEDWAHHENRFEVSDEVQTIEVPINMFFQPSWGASIGPLTEKNMQNVFDISWQTHESWRPASYDITIWDVRIMQ